MKRIVLILIFAGLLLPGFGQSHKIQRVKRHNPVNTAFRLSPKENKKARADDISPVSFLEWGMLGIKNIAQADSSLMFVNTGFKNDDLILLAKEIPVYYDGTFNIRELERWYADEASKEYYPAEKQTAFYDDNNNLVRVESYLWETDQWVPFFATEMENDKSGEEVLYVEYVYNHDATDWEIDYGYRALDEIHENGKISVRIWEYYDSWNRSWVQEEKEEYLYNDDNVLTEMLFSWYNEWEESWEPESRMVFEPGENNTWDSGYAWEWDWFEEEWIRVMKYVDIEWYNYELLQFNSMTVWANPDAMEDIDEFDKEVGDDEIAWMNFMKMSASFNADGKMILMQQEVWDTELQDWIGFFKTEWGYDALNNLTYHAFSTDEGMGWTIVEATMVKYEYNEDQAVSVVDVYVIEEEWKNEFDHFLRFELYYNENVTSIPYIEFPEGLQVFPNPTSSDLQIVWSNSDHSLDVAIVSIDGKIVSRYNHYAVSAGIPVSLDVSHLQNGVYILRCQGDTQTSVARFVKK